MQDYGMYTDKGNIRVSNIVLKFKHEIKKADSNGTALVASEKIFKDYN